MQSVTVHDDKLLSLHPRVWSQGEVLHARTSSLAMILTLFSYCRTLMIYRGKGYIVLRQRWLWFLVSEEVIALKQASHVEYKYGEVATGVQRGAWRGAPVGELYETVGRLEVFRVELVMMEPANQRKKLWTFRGGVNGLLGLSGIVLGDHQEASRSFAQLVTEHTGLPLGPKATPS